jgi:peptidoglycan endopeptidase LytE
MKNSLSLLFLAAVLLTTPSLVFAAKTHKVKKHETLLAIAKKYHVAVADLKTANHLLHSHIKQGELLVIPASAPSVAKVNEPAAGGAKAATYKVKRTEPLSRIAKKTGVSVAELKRINGLTRNTVKSGQVLALRDADGDSEPRLQVAARKPSLRYADLLNDKEYEQGLAELVEQEVAQQVDLSKSIELRTDSVKLLKSKAFGFLGTRYRFGGSSRNGLDCSAFVQKVFREMEVSLPRTAREQFERGAEVSPGDLQKGDLVFFRTYASFPSHVGIYLGNNRMIHASSRDRRVVVSTLNTPYYRSRYLGAKRIAKVNPSTFNLDELMLGVEEEVEDDVPQNDMLGVTLNN